MKRALLVQLAFLSLVLNVPGYAFARLYEARLMGFEREALEFGDAEPAGMCLPVEGAENELDELDAAENLAEKEFDSAPEKARLPPLSAPLL